MTFSFFQNKFCWKSFVLKMAYKYALRLFLFPFNSTHNKVAHAGTLCIYEKPRYFLKEENESIRKGINDKKIIIMIQRESVCT